MVALINLPLMTSSSSSSDNAALEGALSELKNERTRMPRGKELRAMRAKKLAIVPTKTWDEKLTSDIIGKVKEKIVEINVGYFQDQAARAAALVEIKDSIPEGNWMAFCSSGVLPVGSREIQDLVRCEPWLRKVSDEIDKALLGSMAVRALSMIGGVYEASMNDEDEAKKKKAALDLNRIEDRLRGNDRLTVTEVSKELGRARAEKTTMISKKELQSQLERAKEVQEMLEADGDQLKQDKTELEQRVAELESTIDQLKADINTFRSLAGQKAVA